MTSTRSTTPPAPRRPRGEYAKTRARRQEIVEAAVEVFSSAGFHKGSLRDVADRVGLSQAGLLHHYPSKEHLLQAALDWRDELAVEQLGEAAPSGIEMIRGLVELAGHNAGTPELVELHVILSAEGTSADHPLHDYFVRRSERVLTLVTDAFAEMAAAGQLRPDVDPVDAARGMTALWDGLQVMWLMHRDSLDMGLTLRRWVQLLLTVDL